MNLLPYKTKCYAKSLAQWLNPGGKHVLKKSIPPDKGKDFPKFRSFDSRFNASFIAGGKRNDTKLLLHHIKNNKLRAFINKQEGSWVS